MTINHECPYCGQMQMLIVGDDNFTSRELDELAAKSCTCDEAKAFAENRDMQADACDAIKELFKGESDHFRQCLLDLVPYLGEWTLDKISVAGEEVRAVLTRKDASIKVERIKTEKKVRG